MADRAAEVTIQDVARQWWPRRDAGGDAQPTTHPNLVFGGDVHVVCDIADACTTLERKGRVHPAERKKIVIGPGH